MAISEFDQFAPALNHQSTHAHTLEQILTEIDKRETVIWTEVQHDFPQGTEYLGVGAGRLVISLPSIPDNTVAKLAVPQWGSRFTKGTLQNALECHITESHTALSGAVLPCLDYPDTGHRWGIYPRAAPENETTAPNSELQQAWRELEELGFTTSDLFAQENWGSFRGQPYLIDCGYAHPDDECRLSQSIAPECERWAAEQSE